MAGLKKTRSSTSRKSGSKRRMKKTSSSRKKTPGVCGPRPKKGAPKSEWQVYMGCLRNLRGKRKTVKRRKA